MGYKFMELYGLSFSSMNSMYVNVSTSEFTMPGSDDL